MDERKVNILIAEDDQAIGLALHTILKNNLDCTLTLVENGEQAWQKLQQESFDLILSDWNMPVKTGEELLNDVKGSDKTRHLPFVMLTARADMDSVTSAVMLGVTDYIHKPFDREGLIKKIAKVLDSHRKQPTTGAHGQGEAAADSHTGSGDSGTTGNENNAGVNSSRRHIIEMIIEKMKNDEYTLPVKPDTAHQAIELMNEDTCTSQQLAEIINKDVVLTTRLIAVSNTSYYRGSKSSTTLEEAITRLGMKETSNCLWLISNMQMFQSKNSVFQGIIDKLRQHSMATAECAQFIAGKLRLSNPAQYYYMGLMHDIGAVLVMQILEDLYKQHEVNDYNAVCKAIHQLHNQFGAVLLERWKLPQILIPIALYHSTPDQVENPSNELIVINFANLLTQSMGYCLDSERQQDTKLLETDSAIKLGINEALLEELREHITGYMEAMEKML